MPAWSRGARAGAIAFEDAPAGHPGPPRALGPVRSPGGADGAQDREMLLDGLQTTLGQACPSEYRGAQCAFKDSMIHKTLQFTLLIAFRCVLHRCQNQEIRC